MSIELTLLSRVSYGGQEISGPRMQRLLALLASDLRAGCSIGRLVDGVWPNAGSTWRSRRRSRASPTG